LRATIIVQVVVNIALLLASFACLVAPVRAKQCDPFRTGLTKPGAFRWCPGDPPPPMEAPPATVVRARFPWVTVAVILVLVTVFMAETTSTPHQPDDPEFFWTVVAFGGFTPGLVLEGEVQRLFMASLLHFDADHLGHNCMALAMTGWYLERMAGHAWLGCVLGLGVVGGVIGTMLLTPDCLSAGASEAIIAVVAAALVVSLRQPPTGQRLIMRGILLYVGLLTLLPAVVTPDDPDIDNGAHFGGWVAGLAIGWLLWRGWPEDPAGVPMRRLSSCIAVTLACAFLLSSAAVARKFPHYQLAAATLIPPTELPDDETATFAGAQALVTRYPNDPRAHFYMARALIHGDDAPGAERQLRQALTQTAGIEDLLPPSFTTRVRYELAATVYVGGHRTEARAIAHDACIVINVMKPQDLGPYLRDPSWLPLCIVPAAMDTTPPTAARP
jgi:rhomboid protease GluP